MIIMLSYKILKVCKKNYLISSKLTKYHYFINLTSEDLEKWIIGLKFANSKPAKTLVNIGEDLFMKAKL